VALSPPVVTLSATTPASAQEGAAIMLGFNIVEAGDVLENASAYLYTGTAPFDLVAGGFLLGMYPVTKVSSGQYTVSFSDTAPSTAGTLYFEIRVQVATGLVPSYLDSPDHGSGASLPWNMAISLPGTQPCTPVAAFRDTSNSIRMISYGSTSVQFIGGQLAADPVVALSPGCVAYIAARDFYNFVWMAQVDPVAGVTWMFTGPLVIQGQPAITVARNGVVYISVRDPNGSYWLVGYTPGVGFGPWMFIGGVLGSDPAMAASPDGSIYMVGRDMWNAIWSAWFVPGSGMQGWRLDESITKGMPSVVVGTDAYAYIATRDAWNYLYIGRLQGMNWLGWSYGDGQLASDPVVAATGDGTIYVTMVDQWNGVWYRGLKEGAGGPWLPWNYALAELQTVSAAATPGQLYIPGRDAWNALWWYRATTGVWSSGGGTGLTTGTLSAGPR